ncbi:diaminohydroxyphosphoribosylaminopyrimidine deaminase [Micractinium conductrix]|uniref:Flavanone 4-reductase n=1 Tax=Micractinium conductrix TaxID=554055 RepID=A0A2P6V3L8_9CHLO|nr:diaminohydroxyphosphoribosylaminopyrimidine deaminase [Micractinium conductrix]|eukprot:PSC68689.1 diaminohydroxyphosphoribosylaminopyrimidine deaminase [Micractinium conductrix]
MPLVAVTGGAGYVASELIHQLLAKGYSVRATVRSKADTAKVAHLEALAAALPGSLELVEADLLQPGSFDAAFAGCSAIFHTASPFFLQAGDPQAELVDPAVQGTRNVMAAAAKNKGSVKRVVLTSSCAAIKGNANAAAPKVGTTYSEADWNETSTVEGGEAYWVSKVQAEKAAWEVAEREGLHLVTILPEFIMGPVLSSRTDATSMGYLKAWVEGRAQAGSPVFADVRDVARAHVLAAEIPDASGRYIVAASHSTPAALISGWLQERFPECAFEAGEAGQPEEKNSNSRVQKELGLALTPVKETIQDMASTLVALGLAVPKLRQQQA